MIKKRIPVRFNFVVGVATKSNMSFHLDADPIRANRKLGVKLSYADDGYVLSREEAKKLSDDIVAVIRTIDQSEGRS